MRETYDTNVPPPPLSVPILQNVEIRFCRPVLTAKFVLLATFLSLQIALPCWHTRRAGLLSHTIKRRNHKLFYMAPPERVVADWFLQQLTSVVRIVAIITLRAVVAVEKIILREKCAPYRRITTPAVRLPRCARCNNAAIRKYAHPHRLLLMAVFPFTPNLLNNHLVKII